MTETPSFTKRRYVFEPGAWWMAREKVCADRAERMVQNRLHDMDIVFPRTTVCWGIQVAVQTDKIEGEALLPILYRAEQEAAALDMGLLALEALYTADVATAQLPLFGALYRFGKGPVGALQILTGASGLSIGERKTLVRLMRDYLVFGPKQHVLVHGDLHASHIIVNRQTNTLGFIDLEAMHVGNPATNFAQLWIGYHYADAALGRRFYEYHQASFPRLATNRFDADTRFELAIRAYKHIGEGVRLNNSELAEKARGVLHDVLQNATFGDMCLEGKRE